MADVMRAGWKLRMDERRYFEEKRAAWFKRVSDKKMREVELEARMYYLQARKEQFVNHFQDWLPSDER